MQWILRVTNDALEIDKIRSGDKGVMASIMLAAANQKQQEQQQQQQQQRRGGQVGKADLVAGGPGG